VFFSQEKDTALCRIGVGEYTIRYMKEHPLLVTGAAVGALIAVGLAFWYVSSPKTEVIAPLEGEVVEQEPVEEGEELEGEVPSGGEELNASVSGRTVTISGPSEVESRFDGCVYSIGWFGSGGNGLYVEWGDGTNDPLVTPDNEGQSCSESVRTHTYAEPGTYEVRVALWHPGPADAPVTDWEDTVTVTIK